MFSKILIANRGEIACRIMRTAQAMGVECVAVYSDADKNSQHVQMADKAVRIGASPVNESYLLGDVIIRAAVDTGAQAIHPGYGFLSENPDFVDAVEAAGLTFIGPSASAIRAMGFLAMKANEIGYPVLIKARAGGGGKGMRKVEDPKEFAASLIGAQREGEASFGDGHVLIEKYITAPRHIEIQVFGDNHGNVVHLFEQMNYQLRVMPLKRGFMQKMFQGGFCLQRVSLNILSFQKMPVMILVLLKAIRSHLSMTR